MAMSEPQIIYQKVVGKADASPFKGASGKEPTPASISLLRCGYWRVLVFQDFNKEKYVLGTWWAGQCFKAIEAVVDIARLPLDRLRYYADTMTMQERLLLDEAATRSMIDPEEIPIPRLPNRFPNMEAFEELPEEIEEEDPTGSVIHDDPLSKEGGLLWPQGTGSESSRRGR